MPSAMPTGSPIGLTTSGCEIQAARIAAAASSRVFGDEFGTRCRDPQGVGSRGAVGRSSPGASAGAAGRRSGTTLRSGTPTSRVHFGPDRTTACRPRR